MSISFVSLGSPAEGIGPVVLVDLNGVKGNQYLFQCPDGFSRLALEHKTRPSSRLKALFCLSPDAASLGGLGGLLLRLRQDGHEQVEVAGPRGTVGQVLALARVLQWRYPRVLASEADPGLLSLSQGLVYADSEVEVMALGEGEGGEWEWTGPYWLDPAYRTPTQPHADSSSSSEDSSSEASSSDSGSGSGPCGSEEEPHVKQLAGVKRPLTLADTLDGEDEEEDRTAMKRQRDSEGAGPSGRAGADAFSDLDQLFLRGRGEGLSRGRVMQTLQARPAGAQPPRLLGKVQAFLSQVQEEPLQSPPPPAPSVDKKNFAPPPDDPSAVPPALSSYDQATARPLANLFTRACSKPGRKPQQSKPASAYVALVMFVKATGHLLVVANEDSPPSALERHPGFRSLQHVKDRVSAFIRLSSGDGPSQEHCAKWDELWVRLKRMYPSTFVFCTRPLACPQPRGFACSSREMEQLSNLEGALFLGPKEPRRETENGASRPADPPHLSAAEPSPEPTGVDLGPSTSHSLSFLDRIWLPTSGKVAALQKYQGAAPSATFATDALTAALEDFRLQRECLQRCLREAGAVYLETTTSGDWPSLRVTRGSESVSMRLSALRPHINYIIPRPPTEPPAPAPHSNPEEIDLEALADPDPAPHPPLDPTVRAALQNEASVPMARVLAGLPAHPHCAPSVTFLGTGSAEPSIHRAASAILLCLGEWGPSALLDCGEGTWPQLVRCLGPVGAEASLRRLRLVWLSHHHADHVGGTLTILERVSRMQAGHAHPGSTRPPLYVVAPSEVVYWLRDALGSSGGADAWLRLVPFDRLLMEAPAISEALDLRTFEGVPVQHSKQSHALVIEHRSGWKLAYSGDCRPSPAFLQAATGATLLIHEATFEGCLSDRAQLVRHTTTQEALQIIRETGAYRTVLTHFSQRYRRLPEDVPTDCWPLSARPIIAFDGLTLRLDNLIWAPLLQPVLKVALGKPGSGEENEDTGAADSVGGLGFENFE